MPDEGVEISLSVQSKHDLRNPEQLLQRTAGNSGYGDRATPAGVGTRTLRLPRLDGRDKSFEL